MTGQRKNFSGTVKIAYLLLVYPLINLVLCWLFHGENMVVTSLIFFGIILLGYLLLPGGRIRFHKNWLPIIIVMIITLGIAGFRESQVNLGLCLAYIATVFMFLIGSDDAYISKIATAIISRKKFSDICQIIFLIIVIAYTSINGLTAGWNTFVLKGPYLYPHTLAYLLFFMLALNIYFFMKERNIGSLIIGGIDILAIILTGVRSAFLAVCMTLLMMLVKFIQRRQMRIAVIAASVIIVFGLNIYFNGYANSLIDKTIFALGHGSITNGRLQIASTSLRALDLQNNPYNIFFGVGMNNLLKSNQILMQASVHAHNDLIDILVCYGLASLLIYCWSFYKYAEKQIIWTTLTLGILIIGNGLFVYTDCIPMLIYYKILLDSVSKSRKENQKNS